MTTHPPHKPIDGLIFKACLPILVGAYIVAPAIWLLHLLRLKGIL